MDGQYLLVDGATLQPYLSGEKPLSDLELAVAGQVATLLDWQALDAVTHPLAVTFADLDPRSQAIYRAIAAALPGCTVYATGSRVKGSWRSGAADDPKTAIAARVGKPLESDVDVIVLGVDNGTFWRVVGPVAVAFSVRIDRQPATLYPKVLVVQGGTEPCN